MNSDFDIWLEQNYTDVFDDFCVQVLGYKPTFKVSAAYQDFMESFVDRHSGDWEDFVYEEYLSWTSDWNSLWLEEQDIKEYGWR